ncbi:MAG: hypothetical protein LBR36_00985 [Bacteroidales bacterium]|jgi:hypothetical protein|nr:hypothetical protein [Bacteroidales bacterium]
MNLKKGNISKQLIITFLAVGLLVSSCRYPEASPSWLPLNKRIRGAWTVTEVQKNGVKNNTASPTLAESYNASFEFYQNGQLFIRQSDDNVSRTLSGYWMYTQNKKYISVEFDDRYAHIKRDYEIIKFKTKDLKVRFTDENAVVWTLIFHQDISFLSLNL